MSSAIAPSPFTIRAFLDPQNLLFADEAVASIFSVMLGLAAEPVSPLLASLREPAGRTAIVGFSGSMRGFCELDLDSSAARTVASAMLGGQPVEEDASIDDAVGELCNMIAGGWKNLVAGLASTCCLSPPTVVSGCNYKIHTNSASVKLMRTYRFDASFLQLTLHCLGPKSF